MPVIQFEATVEGYIIRIPEEYMELFPSGTKVMVDCKPLQNCRAEAGVLLLDDFTAFIDTKGFKFDREEANERR